MVFDPVAMAVSDDRDRSVKVGAADLCAGAEVSFNHRRVRVTKIIKITRGKQDILRRYGPDKFWRVGKAASMVRRFEDHGLQWRIVPDEVFFRQQVNVAC